MGFLGMLLKSADADAVSHDLTQQTIRTIQDGAAAVEQSGRQAQRHTEVLMAVRIRDLNDEVALLKVELALRDATIGGYCQFLDELFPGKERNSASYRVWRHEDKELDKMLLEGRLKHDPRKHAAWVKTNGYIPPRKASSSENTV